MTIKKTLRAMQQHMIQDVSPLKMPPHPDKPAFYTREQEQAMDWEAQMIALAIHQLDRYTSVPSLHAKTLHELHEKFYANPDIGLKNILNAYRTCMAIKDTKEQDMFEKKYVAEKVKNYRHTHLQATGIGR